MAIEGKLEEIGLADICQLLAMGRKTGCLSVTDRTDFGYLYFEGGLVVHAHVLNRPDRLGEMLLAHGLASPEALEHARSAAAMEDDLHYGRILVRDGLVDAAQVERFARIEVEEAVYHLFAWNEGSFHFETDEAPPAAIPASVAIPAESLLLEGARRVDEWTQIRQAVPTSEAVFRLTGDPATLENPRIEIGPREERVLALVDGERSVRRIVRESGVVEFEVSRIFHALSEEGILEPVRTAGEEPSGGADDEAPVERLELARAFYRAGMWDEAERVLAEIVEEEPSAEAEERLAAIHLRRGEAAEALVHLDRADALAPARAGRLRNRALALELEGRPGEALAVLDAVEGERAAERGHLIARGALLLQLERAEDALAAFRQAEEHFEEPPPVVHALGMLAALMAGEGDEAVRLGRRGIELHPGSGPVLVNLGAVLEARGEHAAAEALYLRATGEDATPAQAHRCLGDLALRRGDRAGARAHYERAVRLDPDIGDRTFEELGTLLHAEGERDLARRLWKRALELNPGNASVRDRLGAPAPVPR